MSVSATIQVAFGTGADGESGHLSAEIDDRADGLNGGDTSFSPGDTAYFLVFKSDNVDYDTPILSAGTLISASVSGGYVERDEDVQFADSNQASLQVPASSVVNLKWLGRSLGGVSLMDDKQTLMASATGVAVAKVTYRAPCTAHGIVSPVSLNGETDFSILCFIRGHLTA